ncbi:nitroreductase family protein [Actinocorallia sp. API 0066]|uniref:nitroreductase family protein n=1 Tax=Actinocorallia sp. API 0066 TaxID=2896846 RepID=UPI001E37C756|nr:nitroreductase family protein [Actinocorallia sp. API 0066]MCD0450000.1 nitroreductase family protein [Actinocorallia sp. API 0066]
MELLEALRGTAAIREFTRAPVSDEALYRVLDSARFAPSGGNQQGWRVVVVKDPGLRRELRDLYAGAWRDYVAIGQAGLRAWSPTADRAAEAAAIAAGPSGDPAGEFVRHLDEVPAMLVVLGDLDVLAAVDRDHDRYTFAGGGSLYPFVWSLLLAAREEGLGGVMTTMHVREEEAVRSLLGVPENFAIVSTVLLGYPARRPTRLKRTKVEDFAWIDSFGGPPLTPEVTGP